MLDSIGKIKEKVHNSIYERDGSNTRMLRLSLQRLKRMKSLKISLKLSFILMHTD